MTYDFFVAEEDKINFLTYIFNQTDLQAFDLYSMPGTTVRQFRTLDNITSHFDLSDVNTEPILLQLWSPVFKAKPTFRKVKLDPKRCDGQTFRYATNGWGLIQLYLHGIYRGTLKPSHIGHFNKAGALNREVFVKDQGDVGDWDWKAVQKASSHLKYLLHKKLSVKTIDTYGVLPGAARLEENGIKLR